jgi:PAS domain-containing protein
MKRKPDALQFDEFGDGSAGGSSSSPKKKKALTVERREDRNLREKERSLKITQQIHELRNLLSMGGVIVPKVSGFGVYYSCNVTWHLPLTSHRLLTSPSQGTKSTILTEAANYICLLQQQLYRLEMDKSQLVQEVQRIGNGAIGEKAAYAIRHAAAQNGVSSIANMSEGTLSSDPQQSVGSAGDQSSDSLGDREYRHVFNSCSIGMAIATMGGSFIDCNPAFTQLSSYTRQELKAMTIFNVTSRDDLQGAFDMMSQLITPPTGGLDADGNSIEENKQQPPVILRSAIRHRSDLGLSVSLIRGDDGVARNFNVTLVKLPSPSLGMSGAKPVPATVDMTYEVSVVPSMSVMQQHTMTMQIQPEGVDKKSFHGLNTPQYTAG